MTGRALAQPAAPTTFERHELKYWATEEQARALRARAGALLDPDPFVATAGPRGAWNVSLYLDSPGLTFFEQHLAGAPDRCKLRIRTYASFARGSVELDRAFLEVKRKVNVMSLKQRTVVSRATALAVAAGRDEPPGLPSPPPRDLEAFLFLRARHRARPVMLVRARRQAFFGRDPGALRVTFDRDIECQVMREPRLEGEVRAWRPIPRAAGVLVEVKFRDGAPGWLPALVAELGLRRTAFSKYVAAVGLELRGTPTAFSRELRERGDDGYDDVEEG